MGGATRIRRSQIKDYGIEFGFRGDDLYDFVWIMQRVDKHLIETIIAEKAKRRSAS